jgi:hypothetical protein
MEMFSAPEMSEATAAANGVVFDNGITAEMTTL